jgi:copper transport protein
VIDSAGARYDEGVLRRSPGDANSLTIAVRPLGPGSYTVTWRVVSTGDGHPASGSYVFGVRTSPAAAAAVAPAPADAPAPAVAAAPAVAPAPVAVSRREVLARGIFLAGLIVLLGAACADVARFGGAANLRLALAGWLLALAGLGSFAAAQAAAAQATLTSLLVTPVGSALVWRGAALIVAGLGLAVAGSRRATGTWGRRVAMIAVLAAACGATGVHVSAGHAGAAHLRWLAVTSQWAHVAASGMWLGGLAALLLGHSGAPSNEKTQKVGRFTIIAAAGLGIVVTTGVVRAVSGLASWDELTGTPYGRTILVKAGLAGAIAMLGAINRWWTVARVPVTLRPLRATGAAELVLAAIVLAAAALLATLPPPASARSASGLTGAGSGSGLARR